LFVGTVGGPLVVLHQHLSPETTQEVPLLPARGHVIPPSPGRVASFPGTLKRGFLKAAVEDPSTTEYSGRETREQAVLVVHWWGEGHRPKGTGCIELPDGAVAAFSTHPESEQKNRNTAGGGGGLEGLLVELPVYRAPQGIPLEARQRLNSIETRVYASFPAGGEGGGGEGYVVNWGAREASGGVRHMPFSSHHIPFLHKVMNYDVLLRNCDSHVFRAHSMSNHLMNAMLPLLPCCTR